MKLFISPHAPSEGASLLAEKIPAVKIKTENSNYRFKNDHIIINWGNSQKMPWYVNGIRILNDPPAVAKAVDKIATLTILKQKNVSVPEFFTDINLAKESVRNGNTVFCRTKTRASGGDGIIIAKTENEVVNAPLYTNYKKKKAEYRVAVVDGVVIDFMQKKKRQDWNVEEKGEINQFIRSHDNGWIFARENVNPPELVLDLAKKSVEALELDFGSVDIIFNETENKAYTLEVNTAPGLEEGGTSLERYSNAFKCLLNNQPIPEVKPIINENTVNLAAPINPPVAQIPVPAPVAPARIVQNVIPANNQENYSFAGVSNISVKKAGNSIKISGEVAGIGKIKVMEIVDGIIKFYFKED